MNNNYNNGYNNGYPNNGYNGSYPDSGFSGYENNGYNGGYTNLGYQNGGYGTQPYSSGATSMTVGDFARKVYAWMFLGLGITFAIGIFLLINAEMTAAFIVEHLEVYYILALVEVALVFILGFFVKSMPSSVCLVIFIAYSALNGLTIAPSLIIFGAESAFMAFAATACIFGGMSIYGMLTKKDLSSLGTILFFGLLGLIVFSCIAMFFNMPLNDLIISLVGIALFVGFTAYDTQKIKKYYNNLQFSHELLQRSAIIAALDLYLDFINLFLYILRLFARSRN